MAKESVSETDYLLATGTIIVVASKIDLYMFFAFVDMSGCGLNIARAIYFTLNAFSSKRSMLQRVATVACKDAAKTKALEDLIKSCKTANKQRRMVAHAPVAFDANARTAMHLKFKDIKNMSMHENVPMSYLQDRIRILKHCDTKALTHLMDFRGMPIKPPKQ